MATRGRAKAVYEMIDGTPSSATSSLWPPKAEATWQPGEADGINQKSLLWIIASAAFTVHLANFADCNASYGTLGAVVGLMTWT